MEWENGEWVIMGGNKGGNKGVWENGVGKWEVMGGNNRGWEGK